jgi:hypothetical protein
MAVDVFTERTHQGWGGRIGNSIKGVVVGVLLTLAAFPVLFWNEGRAVTTARTLAEGAKATVAIGSETIDANHEGKLVHLSGAVISHQTLTDTLFGVSARAVKLVRQVEMYQWHEKKESKEKRNLGGSSETVTTYTYRTDWSPRLIRSSDFKQSAQHVNPTSMPVESATLSAAKPTLGAFTLTASLLEKLPAREVLNVTGDAVKLSADQARTWRVADGRFYRGADPTNPQVGDVRVSYRMAPEGDVSVIAVQRGSSFTPYVASTGKTIELLTPGVVSKEQMFATEVRKNTMLTWALRGLGWVMMMAGLAMVAAPLSVLTDVVPLFGDLARAGTGLVAVAIATPLTLLTIAVAWLAYRPMLSAGLIVAGVAAFVMVKRMAGRRAEGAAEAKAQAAIG